MEDHIMVEGFSPRASRPCALCGAEDAVLRIMLTSICGKQFVTAIGSHCRLLLEGALRAQRKWEIRGGRN